MKTLTLIIITIALSSCAYYEPKTCKPIRDDGTYISGSIEHNLNYCEIDYSDSLKLSSLGGKIDTAIKISNQVKLNDTDTLVKFTCQSACVLISSSGQNREICERAIIGLHRSDYDSGTYKMIDFYAGDPRVNLDEVSAIMWATQYNSMTYLTAEHAVSLGLADKVVECD